MLDSFARMNRASFWQRNLAFAIKCCVLTRISGYGHRALRGGGAGRVAGSGGWHASARIKQIERTPGGTERVLRSESYRFKLGAPNETDDQRKLRLGVKRDAKRRAKDKFQPEKVEQKRAKRSKRGAAAAGVPAPTGAVAPAALLPVAAPAALALRRDGILPAFRSPELLMTRDLATECEPAVLRGFSRLESPAGVLDALRLSGLDDEQPWIELVIERHEFLCRSVRATARLVGPATVASSMHELWWPCACECVLERAVYCVRCRM